ncbi:hypothetical protein QEN19_003246 [Hanseniaspora menglaensis]
MAVSKDRTNLYLSYRNTYPRYKQTQGTALSNDANFNTHLLQDDLDLDLEMGDTIVASNLIMGSSDKSHNIDMIINNIILPIDKNLEKIESLMKQLEQQYKTAILPSFNDGQESDFKRIESTSFEIMKIIQTNFKYIKFIKEHIQNNRGNKGNEFIIILTNMNTNYASKIQNKSNDFKALQNKYLKFLNKNDLKPLPTLNQKSNEENMLLLEEEDEQIKNLMTANQNQQILATKQKDQYLYKRDQDILELSQNVLEINNIFRDLQSMIIDQSSIVNNIESNIYEFQNDVVEAKREIEISDRYNKKESKCKIILFFVLLCILILLLILTKK